MRKTIRKPVYIKEEIFNRVKERAEKQHRSISGQVEFELEMYQKIIESGREMTNDVPREN